MTIFSLYQEFEEFFLWEQFHLSKQFLLGFTVWVLGFFWTPPRLLRLFFINKGGTSFD